MIEVLEASYRMDVTEATWLEDVVKAVGAHIDRGHGLTGYVYDATDLDEVKIGSFWADGRAILATTKEHVQAIIRQSHPDYVKQTWRGLPCSLVSETPDIERQPGYTAMRGMGIHDIFVVNGSDPTWHGCWIGALIPEPMRLEAEQRALWARVAAHIAAGFRLRRRLADAEGGAGTAGAEAVLEPNPASSRTARELLRDAARAIDRARTADRRGLVESVDEWRGLIAARWSLVDHFESDGRRYLCARRNDAAAGNSAGLTDREYQVVAFLSLGHTTKLIAYELGITPSTVRVLLGRAAAKLGAKSREELIKASREGAFTFASKP
jgi:DNA-binding CsgD family transcriptional regulator